MEGATSGSPRVCPHQILVRVVLIDLQTRREGSEIDNADASPYRARLVAQYPNEL